MIQSEYLNEGTLVKHYSDLNVYLLQNETGKKYTTSIDTVPCQYTYSETDEVIKKQETKDSYMQLKAQAYNIITGEEK